MSKTFTRYQVLIPTSVPNLYKEAGIFVMETEHNQTKLPEYIRSLLVESGEYPVDIKVLRVN